MAKLRVGVVGVGSIGNVHLTGYEAAKEQVEIYALADTNPERLQEMGTKFGVPAERQYADSLKMISENALEVISVCTPNKFHFEYAMAAIISGANTMIEKPVVLTMEEAETLRRTAEGKSNKIMVPFSHRFMRHNIAAKAELDRGVIGNPFMIRVRYAHGGPYPGWAQSDWFYNPDLAGGGALLDMGIHAIDICQYFIGPIKSISAQIRTLRKPIAVDDNAIMMLDFGDEKRCLGYIECGWTSGPGFAGIEIYGDKGSIILPLFDDGTIMLGTTNPDGTVTTKQEKLPANEGSTHWPFQMECWVDYLTGKPTITKIPGLEEGISSLAVALAATESSQTGRRIDL